MSVKLTRRTFNLATAAAAAVGSAATARSAKAVAGANERIRVASIGVGNRGSQLLNATLPNKDVEVVALCDVYKNYLDAWANKIGGSVEKYSDFRQLLDRKDIDAVFIATPDHWHALQTILACDAGKDVYIEKPLSIVHHEGQKMIEAARRSQRVVQVGLHRRSSALFPQLAELIKNGAVGKVTLAQAFRISNMYPDGIGKAPDSDPPADLDWDMWLGPRPKRAFNKNIAPYKFRWWQAYSSQLGNWGVHYFDLLRWLLEEEAPLSVSAHGGKFAIDDSREIPDTLQAIFEFASGRLMLFGQYEASGVAAIKGEFELRGTQGAVYADSNHFEIVPEHGGQFQSSAPRAQRQSVNGSDHDLTAQHVRNFLDCVKSRHRPNCDVEVGHRSTTFAHLANIALATKSRIEWDAKAERITNNEAANQLLSYEYRAPWKLA